MLPLGLGGLGLDRATDRDGVLFGFHFSIFHHISLYIYIMYIHTYIYIYMSLISGSWWLDDAIKLNHNFIILDHF